MMNVNGPTRKRKLMQMFYTGGNLPLGIRLWNQKKIDWTMDNVIIPQCNACNIGEQQIYNVLMKNKFDFQTQYPIVIADEDKTIRRIFVADFLIDHKVIVEVDGWYHDSEFDAERDRLTSERGFKTLRIPRDDNNYNEEQIVSKINDLLKD